MYSFKRLLVCLDFSELDTTLIKEAAAYANFGRAQDIFFLTVVRNNSLPTELENSYPALIDYRDKRLEHKMREEIEQAFHGSQINFHFDVLEGDPTYEIIIWARQNDIDLIVLGKKDKHWGRGVTSRKIVNVVHCSTLFVPAGSKINLKKLAVASDFSEVSVMALQKSIKIGSLLGATVECIHCYEVPTSFHVTGKTYDEFAEILLSNSQLLMKKFLHNEDLKGVDIKPVFLLDRHGHPSEPIIDYVVQNKFELLVIGSHGRSAVTSMLLGSVAAKIVESDIPVPVLVVKSKKDNMKFVDALLGH